MEPASSRILTTHAGSLPRPDPATAVVWPRRPARGVDAAIPPRAEIQAAVRRRSACRPTPASDILNDGEVSKPSYATYVKDRLTGFGGEGSIQEIAASVDDLERLPGLRRPHGGDDGARPAEIRFTACDGPVATRGQAAVQADIDNLKAAVRGVTGRTASS